MSRILVMEDEHKIQEILVEFLNEYGYETDSAYDGVEGLALFQKNAYDLVLLDIMMPKIDGFAVLELIRKSSRVPVVIITAMETEADEIKGFDLQADDYITKPFSMNLVLRRIEAVLRRNQSHSEAQAPNLLKHRQVTLDVAACKVRSFDKAVALTYKEFEIIKLLLENKNKVFTRDELLRQVWGYDFAGDDKVVNNHIMRIRKKLGDDFIVTVRAMGYKIDEES